MSYDVNLVCGHCECPQTGGHNYTYNLSEMFHWALGESLKELHGLKGTEAAVKLEHAIAKCEAEENLERFDPPNGWGNHDTALEFLRNIRKDCLAFPACEVRIT